PRARWPACGDATSETTTAATVAPNTTTPGSSVRTWTRWTGGAPAAAPASVPLIPAADSTITWVLAFLERPDRGNTLSRAPTRVFVADNSSVAHLEHRVGHRSHVRVVSDKDDGLAPRVKAAQQFDHFL